jgi:hypothetical protein
VKFLLLKESVFTAAHNSLLGNAIRQEESVSKNETKITAKEEQE